MNSDAPLSIPSPSPASETSFSPSSEVKPLSERTMLKGLIFDLDGTLIDSLGDIAFCVNHLLRENQWPEHPVSAFGDMIGDGVVELIRKAVPAEVLDEAKLDGWVQRYRELYSLHWDRETKVFEGMVEVLEGLKQAGFRLAVLSNKPHDFTLQCVDRFLPSGLFDHVLGHREGHPRKPEPDGVLEIVHAWNLSPREYAYVGDSGLDMVTARRAGALAVGVAWGFRSVEELRREGLEVLCETVSDLSKLVS